MRSTDDDNTEPPARGTTMMKINSSASRLSSTRVPKTSYARAPMTILGNPKGFMIWRHASSCPGASSEFTSTCSSAPFVALSNDIGLPFYSSDDEGTAFDSDIEEEPQLQEVEDQAVERVQFASKSLEWDEWQACVAAHTIKVEAEEAEPCCGPAPEGCIVAASVATLCTKQEDDDVLEWQLEIYKIPCWQGRMVEERIVAALLPKIPSVGAAPADPEAYALVALEKDDIRRPYTLPTEYTANLYDEPALDEINSPLVVFINSRSGGRAGTDLTLAMHRALGRMQVFDLSKNKPDVVLRQLWANFDAAKAAGDTEVDAVRGRLRLVVAGGDGTIAWVMGVIKKLRLTPEPPLAIIPLGTGNDLSRSFGWGAAFEDAWAGSHAAMYNLLRRVAVAQPATLDCWSATITLPSPELKAHMPYSLAPETDVRSSGMFWNYMSIGLDAKAAHGFHEMREKRPWLASGRMLNQALYSWYSCASGWFCCTKGITTKVRLEAKLRGSDVWSEVEIPVGVKALVVLNLQSYAGGRNLWGDASDDVDAATAGFVPPTCSDGLVDVVGLANGYHTGCVMATKGDLVHAVRVCQASALRLHVKAKYVRGDGRRSHAYLQVDGEPWKQRVPSANDDDPLVIEVAYAGQSVVLSNDAGLHPTRLTEPYEAAMQAALETTMIAEKTGIKGASGRAASAILASSSAHSPPGTIVLAEPASPTAGTDGGAGAGARGGGGAAGAGASGGADASVGGADCASSVGGAGGGSSVSGALGGGFGAAASVIDSECTQRGSVAPSSPGRSALSLVGGFVASCLQDPRICADIWLG
ncbi:hypothetical protein FOA52_011307 [Chlamydomonas sp. UWO 241]|nr:hypothetical protein FOA52_011307 [Chlamydomonas sp. UWO 241]